MVEETFISTLHVGRLRDTQLIARRLRDVSMIVMRLARSYLARAAYRRTSADLVRTTAWYSPMRPAARNGGSPTKQKVEPQNSHIGSALDE
jgi:hypothetical protein